MNKIEFSQDQLDLIVNLHNQGLLNREIAETMGVSKSTIGRILNRLSIPSRHPKLNQEREKMICDLYQQYHNKSIVSELGHVEGRTISMILQKYGIYELSQGEVNRRFNVNDHYFDNIDTPNKAYFLGLLFSDGTMSTRDKHIVRISLQESDREILEKMLDDMDATYHLYYIPYSKKNQKWKD